MGGPFTHLSSDVTCKMAANMIVCVYVKSGFVGCGSNVLQVCGLPAGLPCSQLDSYLSDLVACFSVRRFDIVRDSWHVPSSAHAADTVDGCCVLAVFDSDDAAHTALTCHSSAKYRLQPYTG